MNTYSVRDIKKDIKRLKEVEKMKESLVVDELTNKLHEYYPLVGLAKCERIIRAVIQEKRPNPKDWEDDFYGENGTEIIKIEREDGTVTERPLQVKHMRIHTKEQLSQLREDPERVWTVNELRKVEGW